MDEAGRGAPLGEGETRRAAAGWAAILFDLDGTLADTIELILRCYRHTMRVHLGVHRPDEEWLATLGRPLRDQLRAFARCEEEAAAMLETYSRYQRRIHDGMVRPYGGVPEVVARLAERGTPMAVVTSKRREMAVRTLARCGLDGRFSVLISADDVANGKPDPAAVTAALAALGGPDPRTVLFVGDSPYDMVAGRRAGVVTAAALWGAFPRDALVAAGPDYVLERIHDLLTLTPGPGPAAP